MAAKMSPCPASRAALGSWAVVSSSRIKGCPAFPGAPQPLQIVGGTARRQSGLPPVGDLHGEVGIPSDVAYTKAYSEPWLPPTCGHKMAFPTYIGSERRDMTPKKYRVKVECTVDNMSGMVEVIAPNRDSASHFALKQFFHRRGWVVVEVRRVYDGPER